MNAITTRINVKVSLQTPSPFSYVVLSQRRRERMMYLKYSEESEIYSRIFYNFTTLKCDDNPILPFLSHLL